MDLKISILILVFTFNTANLTAQNVINMISCDEYNAITYNGKTIDQINATNAKPHQVQQLWGNYSSINELGENRSRVFYFGDNWIGFTYDVKTFVTRITITNNQWSVIINGKTVRVGDSVTSLHQKFGSNLIIAQSQYRERTFVAFGCIGKDEGVDLEINPETNKVSGIIYFVSP